VTFAPVAAFALSNHAGDWGSDDEQPFGITGAAGAGSVVLSEASLGRRQAGLRLLLGGSRLVEAPRRRRSRARQAFGALAVPRRQCQRRLGFRARALQLWKVGRRRRRRQQAGEFQSARHARTNRDVDDARQAAVDRRDHVSGAARSGFDARSHTNGLTDRLFLHDRCPEVQAPLLFLQEADARCGFSGARRGGAGGVSIRVHVDLASTMFVVQPGRLRTITSSRLPAWAGFTSTPKIPGRDGASTRNTSG
jgi:hypothetical protein